MVVGILVGLTVGALIGIWGFSKSLKEKLLLRLKGKTELDSLDLDLLIRLAITIALFIPFVAILTVVIIQFDL
jgi:hypothetical protein